MERPITLREAYRGLRNLGCDRFTAGFLALVWVLKGVKVSDE